MFDVGDTVVYTGIRENLTQGKEYKVESMSYDGIFTRVTDDHGEKGKGYCTKDFELVEQRKEQKQMSKVIYTYSGDSVTVVLNGEIFTITSSEKSYEPLVEELKKSVHDVEVIEDLLDKRKVVEKYSNGSVTIEGSTVFYKGEVVNDSLTDKMISMMDEGFDITPWVKFFENLMENPSYRSRNCLFNFLEKFQAPFTEDGCFVAFKRVRQDFKDLYTGKMDNSVGAVVKMDRRNVNEDPSATCSAGLHVAASSYLDSYANADRARTIMLKVNPRDVVAVPHDYNFAKMRVCEYEVIADITVDQMKDLETRTIVTDDWEVYDGEPDTDWEVDDWITYEGPTEVDITVGKEYQIAQVDNYDETVLIYDDAGGGVWLNFDGTYN